MSSLGTEVRPLRVAIIGSGPSGFYAADSLFKSTLAVKVDMFDKLPSPFGLVRYGVAPDHAKIKNVTKVYEKIAAHDRFDYFGNVHVGVDVSIEELKQFYEAIIIATGAESDRKLGIHGEDLAGSHTATEFVAWYNGHPHFQNRVFNLDGDVAVVVGQGNVAMDVCRILCKTIDELRKTDITARALEVLAESRIKEVHMIGRRGPAQAAFTPPEIKEFGELSDCLPVFHSEELELNESSRLELDRPENSMKKKNYEIMLELARMQQAAQSRKFFIHFRCSPIEIIGNSRVQKVVLERNQLVGEPNFQKARGTGDKFDLDCDIMFRSIGYRGVPLKGLPFHDQAGVIPNMSGRVMDSEVIFTGLYVTGWIKRGPSGVIGTNKPDSEETVKHLLQDIPHFKPCVKPSTQELKEFLTAKELHFISFPDWLKIDAAEIARGEKLGKPREKFTKISGMLAALTQ